MRDKLSRKDWWRDMDSQQLVPEHFKVRTEWIGSIYETAFKRR